MVAPFRELLAWSMANPEQPRPSALQLTGENVKKVCSVCSAGASPTHRRRRVVISIDKPPRTGRADHGGVARFTWSLSAQQRWGRWDKTTYTFRKMHVCFNMPISCTYLSKKSADFPHLHYLEARCVFSDDVYHFREKKNTKSLYEGCNDALKNC